MRALEETAKESGGKEQYVNMLYYLLKMRQACNHPWLVKGLGQRWAEGVACVPRLTQSVITGQPQPGR